MRYALVLVVGAALASGAFALAGPAPTTQSQLASRVTRLERDLASTRSSLQTDEVTILTLKRSLDDLSFTVRQMKPNSLTPSLSDLDSRVRKLESKVCGYGC